MGVSTAGIFVLFSSKLTSHVLHYTKYTCTCTCMQGLAHAYYVTHESWQQAHRLKKKRKLHWRHSTCSVLYSTCSWLQQNELYIGNDPATSANLLASPVVRHEQPSANHVPAKLRRGRGQVTSSGQPHVDKYHWGATQTLTADEMMLSGSSYKQTLNWYRVYGCDADRTTLCQFGQGYMYMYNIDVFRPYLLTV